VIAPTSTFASNIPKVQYTIEIKVAPPPKKGFAHYFVLCCINYSYQSVIDRQTNIITQGINFEALPIPDKGLNVHFRQGRKSYVGRVEYNRFLEK
jgi:hypothetical protein